MWRMYVVMLGGLLFPLSPAAHACCDAPKPVAPAPAGDYVKKTMLVELRGKVVLVRCLMFGVTSTGVTIGDNTFWLDLRDRKDLQPVVQSGATVRVTGTIEKHQGTDGRIDFLVKVTDIRADDAGQSAYVRKTTGLEIRGKLGWDTRDIERPYEVYWYVSVDGKDYYLHLKGNKTLIGQVKDLAGQTVVMTGTLEFKDRWRIVHVATINAAPASPFKITFGRTSGIPDFHPIADVVFDSTKLRRKTVDDLRKLIVEAKFFDLRSSMDPPPHVPDPPAGYNLALEMDGKKHRIWVTYGDMTPALSALVDRLKEARTEAFCHKLIGLNLDEAKRQIADAGYTHRLVRVDDVSFELTDDLRRNRINLTVEKGKVVGAAAY